MNKQPNEALHFPATSRNRDAITAVLEQYLPTSGTVLEIGSGSGEHIVHFAQRFPSLIWQPSDLNQQNIGSITAWMKTVEKLCSNLRAPLLIDAVDTDLIIPTVDAIICINVIHISPWNATEGLMNMAAKLLPTGGMLYLYGPYLVDGISTAPSNVAFDQQLKVQNKHWGIRNMTDVVVEAERYRLSFIKKIKMPANNLSLIFRK